MARDGTPSDDIAFGPSTEVDIAGAARAETERYLAAQDARHPGDAIPAYYVVATPGQHAWELDVRGIGLIQVKYLGNADQQVRDLIETVTDAVLDADVRIVINR